MAEPNESVAPDNQNGPVVTPEIAGTTSTEAPQVSTGGEESKLEGKSREEIMTIYQNLERKMHEQAEENKQLRTFTQRVGPFFEVDPTSGNIQFNDEMIKKYAEVKGFAKPEEKKATEQPPEAEERFMEDFEKNPQGSIKSIVENALNKILEEKLSPIQNQFAAHQHQAWINEVTSKHPDFQQWRTKTGEFINKYNFPVNSPEDLERALLATKASQGALVDKAQAEQNLASLQNSLTAQLGGSLPPPPRNEDEMTNMELLGLDAPQSEKSKAIQELFGKPQLE